MSKKFYAVKVGRIPGVYETWTDCQKQTSGFSGAVYKAFTSFSEASEFLNITHDVDDSNIIGSEKENMSNRFVDIYVDGSFDNKTLTYSYGMVVIDQGKKETFSGKGENKSFASMHNVAGELMGAVKAMDYALENKEKFSKLVIHYDYEGIEKWCTGEWKTKNKWTKKYVDKYRNVVEIIDIDFVKILAHSGHEYNDLADNLARSELGMQSCLNQIVTEETSGDKLFKSNKKILSILKEEIKGKKSSIVFNFNGFDFNDQKAIKLIRELYKTEGGSVKDIDRINANFNFSSLEYKLALKDGSSVIKKIEI